ncbi:uncharacterized protein LOC128216948 [Mya arenaria]|uniref:uncharacterized protein LOC128216948 n=1 Tax=Mya arenaria TaxID=6604 RepID=UPI0022E52B9B|nr:uncharacterized protein LOC128216948 [Mya arenaria]
MDYSREDCYYLLQAPDGYLVEMTVSMVTFGTKTCSDERIIVRDGVGSHAQSLLEICSEHAEGAKNEVRRGRNLFIEYTNKAGGEGARFQLAYTVVVDNFAQSQSPVGGDNECSGRLLNSDGDFEFTYTTPEIQDKTLCVPSYTVTIRHDHRCERESQCEINQCDNGGTCVKKWSYRNLSLYGGILGGVLQRGRAFCW